MRARAPHRPQARLREAPAQGEALTGSRGRLDASGLPPGPPTRLGLDLGGLPAPLDALGHAPGHQAAVVAVLEAALLSGQVPRTTKELVALAVLARTGVAGWARALRASLEARAVPVAVLLDLEARGETARLPERTQRVVAFGRRAALQPALLADLDFARLRRDGLGDAELAELLALGGALALVVALARALGQTGEAPPPGGGD